MRCSYGRRFNYSISSKKKIQVCQEIIADDQVYCLQHRKLALERVRALNSSENKIAQTLHWSGVKRINFHT